MEFFRFPHTPHLVWLGPGRPRGDKVLSPDEARALLGQELTVEEKVDGTNIGFSVDEGGTLKVQSRGAFLRRETRQPQFKPLFHWLEPRKDALREILSSELMLFGEWCYAVHSVRYTRLPDWFMAFDVYDRRRGEFYSVSQRNALVGRLGIEIVPQLAAGRFDLAGLQSMFARSRLSDSPPEGLYLRFDRDDRLVARAKLVRAEFVESIEEHWSRRMLAANALAGGRRGEEASSRSMPSTPLRKRR